MAENSPESASSTQPSLWPLAISLTVGMAALFLFGACFRWCWRSTFTETPQYNYRVPSGVEAADHCKDAVRAKLAAPSTAQFAPTAEARVTHGGQYFTVETWVDAQNVYGAMIRNSATCRMRYAQGDTGWVDERVWVR